MKIWYICQFASMPNEGKYQRQFSLCKYMANDVSLFAGRHIHSSNFFFWSLNKKNIYDDVNLILINGILSKSGINIKRILSMLNFELFLLISTFFTKKSERPDVIIASSLSLFSFCSGVILSKKFNCKLIIEVRDIWPESPILAGKLKEKSALVKILRRIELLGYRKSNGIVATMPKFDLYMQRKYPSISFNFCHLSQGYDKQVQITESIEYKLPEGFNVCYAGNFDFADKIELMVDSAILLHENKNIHFYFIGNGPMKDVMKFKTNKFKTITFLDSIPKAKVISFLSKFNLLIMAMRDLQLYDYGISPNKMVDYLLSGKPLLVAYNGYKDILNEVNCGKYIETDNPQLLADTILEFSKMDKNELIAMGKRGKKYAESNMDFEMLSTKLLEFIKLV